MKTSASPKLHQHRIHLLRAEHSALPQEKEHAWRKGASFTVAQRIRWYCNVRYWRQALAAASIYGGAFAIWMLAVR